MNNNDISHILIGSNICLWFLRTSTKKSPKTPINNRGRFKRRYWRRQHHRKCCTPIPWGTSKKNSHVNNAKQLRQECERGKWGPHFQEMRNMYSKIANNILSHEPEIFTEMDADPSMNGWSILGITIESAKKSFGKIPLKKIYIFPLLEESSCLSPLSWSSILFALGHSLASSRCMV